MSSIGDTAPHHGNLSEESFAELRAALFSADLTVDDILRWYTQGFTFSDAPAPVYGLRQQSGGPCGVLGAVQAYILCILLFQCDLPKARAGVVPPSPVSADEAAARLDAASPAALHDALVRALAFVIWQAAKDNSPMVATLVCAQPAALPVGPESPAAAHVTSHHSTYESLCAAVAAAASQFASPSGVALLVYSVLLSRGVARVREDADEPGSLVVRWGHMGQELLNLLLCGEAVTGVTDGEHRIGEGDACLTLRGISRPPLIGYLSHLEALRYSSIGFNLKHPTFPVWLVGSESHFTVLWGTHPGVNEDSPSAHAFRAFSVYDAHGSQFIPVESVPAVLASLGPLPGGLDTSAAAAEAFAKALDTSGAGIVTWQDFWPAVAPMLRKQGGAGADGSSSGSGSGSGSGASSSSSAAAAAAAASEEAAYERLLTQLRTSFAAVDGFGGGFVLLDDVQRVLEPLALAAYTASGGVGRIAMAALKVQLQGDQPAGEAIVLLPDLEAAVEPALREHAATQAALAASAGTSTGAGSAGSAGAGAGAAAHPGVSAGTKRPRSDSDYARELQMMEDAGSVAPLPPSDRPANGGSGGSGSGGGGGGAVKAKALKDLNALDISNALAAALAAVAPAPDTSSAAAAAPAPGAAAPAAAVAGPSAAAAPPPRQLSLSDFGDFPMIDSPPQVIPAAAVGGAGAGAGAGAASSSSSSAGQFTRSFDLYHYNGLCDRGRVPRVVRMHVRQLESGLPPVASSADAMAVAALTDGGGYAASLGGIEEQMAQAIAISAAEAASRHGGAEAGGGAGAGGRSEDELALDALAAIAAMEAAEAEAEEKARASSGGAAPAPAADPAADPAAPAAAAAAAPAPAAGPTMTVAQQTKLSSVVEGILRTKWPGVVVSFDGMPPVLD